MSGIISEQSGLGPRPAQIRDTAAQDTVLDDKPQRRRRWRLASAAVVLAGVAAVAISPTLQRFASAERSIPRERLRLATVVIGDFTRDVAVRGRVVAAVKPTVYAPAQGTVNLLVEAGETVEKGAILARLNSPALANELDQQLAILQRLETEVTRQGIEKKQRELRNQQTTDLAEVAIQAAARELRRAVAAWDERLISRQDYEEARDELARARLEYEHAKQNALLERETLTFELKTRALERDRQGLLVEDLQRRVQELTIASPVGGMVGSLAVEHKAAVAENQPLMTVVDLTAFEIEIQVPQEYGDDLALMMPVEITFGRESYTGQIKAISPEVEQNQVTARVRFSDTVPSGLRQNQRVSARVLLESRSDVLKVKRGAFLDSGGGRLAYVVDGDLATRVSIQTGSVSISEVEILGGLNKGQTIVISDIGGFENADTLLLSN